MVLSFLVPFILNLKLQNCNFNQCQKSPLKVNLELNPVNMALKKETNFGDSGSHKSSGIIGVIYLIRIFLQI